MGRLVGLALSRLSYPYSARGNLLVPVVEEKTELRCHSQPLAAQGEAWRCRWQSRRWTLGRPSGDALRADPSSLHQREHFCLLSHHRIIRSDMTNTACRGVVDWTQPQEFEVDHYQTNATANALEQKMLVRHHTDLVHGRSIGASRVGPRSG